jgi:hypothetical protein
VPALAGRPVGHSPLTTVTLAATTATHFCTIPHMVNHCEQCDLEVSAGLRRGIETLRGVCAGEATPAVT